MRNAWLVVRAGVFFPEPLEGGLDLFGRESLWGGEEWGAIFARILASLAVRVRLSALQE
jgi:hypothetical protein